MHFDIAGSSAVKAQDELPALGLDCAPRRPNTLAIRAIGKNSMTSQYTTLDTDRPSHGRPMHSLNPLIECIGDLSSTERVLVVEREHREQVLRRYWNKECTALCLIAVV